MAWSWNNESYNPYSCMSYNSPNHTMNCRNSLPISQGLDEPQCRYCNSYWHDEWGCPQKPQEANDSPCEFPCCYCKSPFHMGRNCSHNDNLRKAYDNLDKQRKELLLEARMFGSSRVLEEEIEELVSSMNMLLNGMIWKNFKCGEEIAQPMDKEQVNIATVTVPESETPFQPFIGTLDQQLTPCTVSQYQDVESLEMEHIDRIREVVSANANSEAIISVEDDCCWSHQEGLISNLTEVHSTNIEAENAKDEQEGNIADNEMINVAANYFGIDQSSLLHQVDEVNELHEENESCSLESFSQQHCEGLNREHEPDLHSGNALLDVAESHLLQKKENDAGQQAENSAIMQMEAPATQFKSFQIVCTMKGKSRSEPHESNSHFLDFLSIECSSACHNGHRSLHASSAPFFDELISKEALTIERPIHEKFEDLNEYTFVGFIFLPHAISNLQYSFHLILSCDLPPDIEKLFGIEYDLSRFALDSIVEILSNLKWNLKYNHDSMHEIISYDLQPDLVANQHASSQYMIFIEDISAYSWLFLQKLGDKEIQGDHFPPYISQPLPIKPEPPPKECYKKEDHVLKQFQILIQDENFCFKSLKRFHIHGCPFPFLT